MNKISSDLFNKIKKEMKIIKDVDYGRIGFLKFNNSENNLYDECTKWFLLGRRGSFRNHKIEKIGRFFGVWPIDIGEGYIEFSVDKFEEESWKDWFILN